MKYKIKTELNLSMTEFLYSIVFPYMVQGKKVQPLQQYGR